MPSFRMIPLSGKNAKGRVALVDAEDYEQVSLHRWHVLEGVRHDTPYGPYAQTRIVGKTVRMHNLITGWHMVDHVNHDGLDNRRENLRIASGSLNQANTHLRVNKKTSRFKGVYKFKHASPRNPWHARIKIQGKSIHLGYFSTEEEGARAYDAAARAAWGEYAYVNFPEES